jgi:hypothetical protein
MHGLHPEASAQRCCCLAASGENGAVIVEVAVVVLAQGHFACSSVSQILGWLCTIAL